MERDFADKHSVSETSGTREFLFSPRPILSRRVLSHPFVVSR